jgi:hypothetical protein
VQTYAHLDHPKADPFVGLGNEEVSKGTIILTGLIEHTEALLINGQYCHTKNPTEPISIVRHSVSLRDSRQRNISLQHLNIYFAGTL